MPTDIFISYRRKDSERVLPLIDALRNEDVSHWLDTAQIGEFGPITDKIRKGLSESKALLAWYSAEYPKSRPCQMELAAAFIAAQREGDPRRRVLIVNPESAPAHIEPIELRDAQYAAAPKGAAGYGRLAKRIAAHVATLAGPLGSILPIVRPGQYGLKLAGASRFVGRLPDLWRIHSALHATESAIVSGASSAGLAQVTGLGGVGKSLLAEEYALRFGAAYPGGIFWLRAFGNDPTQSSSADAREAVRADQFAAIATALGIETKGLGPAQVEALLAAKLSHEGKPFLWIVDDLASGLGDAVRAWLAPSLVGKTLLTTRSREYGAIGTSLALGVLRPQEAFDLLSARRKPVGPDEEAAALGIAADLGGHALAVDVTAAALAAQAGLVSFAQFRMNLADPAADELEFAAELAEMLPSNHEKNVAATLLRSVRSLSAEGQDFLRLASLLAVAPIPPKLVASTFAGADGLEEPRAKRRAALALSAVETASLAERAEGDARLVHTLASRTVRHHDEMPERTAVLRAAVVASLAEILPDGVPDVGDIRVHQKVAMEVQHARALCASMPDANSARLAAWVVRHDSERGLHAAAMELAERVLKTRRRVVGEEHPDTLTSMVVLATLRGVQGDLGGMRALLERALEAQRRLLGEEHPDTLMSMNHLAQSLWAQGDLAGARVVQHRVLETRRRVLGEEHPDTLISMDTLGLMLSALGDHAGARALQEQALEALRRVLGEEHPDTLRSMSNFAQSLLAEGDLARGRALQQRVLEVRFRLLGERHRDTTVSAWNLMRTLLATEDYNAARGVLGGCLAWLLAADAESLSDAQQTVKGYVTQLVSQARSE